MATITVKDAAGTDREIEVPNGNGRQAAAGSRPVALSNEDLAAINAITTAISTALSDVATDTGLGAIVSALAGKASAEDVASIVTALGGTLEVRGPLTDAQLRAAAVPVDVTFPETQPVSAEALPLPSGAATAAKQDQAKASLDKLSSAKNWFAITPADSALPDVPDAIYVGGDGDLVLRGVDDADATFAVVAGQILPVSPTQVRTGTTATGLIGLIA